MHFVIINEWALDDQSETKCGVLAVAHSLEEAKATFKELVLEDIELADTRDWDVYTCTDTEFDAGLTGEYSSNHTVMKIVEVE